MSSLYARLHRIISSTHKTTNPLKLEPKTPKPPNDEPPIRTLQKLTKHQDPTANGFVWTLLREKNPEKLLQRFKYLSKLGSFRRKNKLYDVTIHRLTLANRFSLIEDGLEHQKKYITRESFATRIIFLYGKAGMFEHAHQLFDELPERKCERGVKSFNALLGAAVNSQKFDKVNELFREVPVKLSIKPDADSYSTKAHALCKLGLFDDAVSLLDEMGANGIEPSIVFFNTLMGAFYGKGDDVRGERVWEKMVKSGVVPDSCSYGYKVRGLVGQGELFKAIDLVKALKKKGLKPNIVTFNSLIQGFCESYDLAGAKKWYSYLLRHGCVPDKRTFDILVPFLCDMGDYGLAFMVCKRKFKWLCSVDEASLQKVVDGLVKESMIEEAKILVELGKSNSFNPYNLVMPSTV